ncbi:MAG: dockerin type I domain-containing protein [Planctomycetota bacterium]
MKRLLPQCRRRSLGRRLVRRLGHSMIERLEYRTMLAAEGAITTINLTEDVSSLVGNVTGEVRWGDGTTTAIDTTLSNEPGPLKFQFDYSQDNSSLFDNPQARQALELAGRTVLAPLNDSLSAIIPNPGQKRNWSAVFPHPSTQRSTSVSNLRVDANTIVVFVGGRDWGGNILGRANLGGFNIPGVSSFDNQAQLDAWVDFTDDIRSRDQTGVTGDNPNDYASWGGAISFDISNRDWHFGTTTNGLDANQPDFVSVAMHELLHILGFGLSPSWNRLVSGNAFTGSASRQAYRELGGSGNAPVVAVSHWATPLVGDRGNFTLMEEQLLGGRRQPVTSLDLAGLDDLGWEVERRDLTVNATHVYGDDGSYDAQLVLTGSTAGQLIIDLPQTVTNADPMLVAPENLTVTAKQSTPALTWTISDPSFRLGDGANETYSFQVDFGDGSSPQSGTATITRNGNATQPTLASFDLTHRYTAAGRYTVSASVSDGDGGDDVVTFVVDVQPAPPVELALNLSRSILVENDGDDSIIATVQRVDTDLQDPITVVISGDDDQLILPPNVTIEANDSSASFLITPVQDLVREATSMLSIEVGGPDFVDASRSLTLFDDDNPFQNTDNPLNVSGMIGGDDDVTALDALQVINLLNRLNGDVDIATFTYQDGDPQADVNGDLRISALDALLVINFLNAADLNNQTNQSTAAVGLSDRRVTQSLADEERLQAFDRVLAETETLF